VEKKFNEETASLQSQINDISLEVKALQDKRGILVKNVDAKVFAQYDRLLNIRSGLAVAAVRSENCGACYMRVSPQTINSIKMYTDLVFCESCMRILYIPEDIGS